MVEDVMIIYFIQEEPDGAIKIGQTSNISKRLASLQTGGARQLKVLHSFEVSDERANQEEKHIHHCFRNRRMRGEWFSPCPYMYDYIDYIKKNGYFVTWEEKIQEEFDGDKFCELYNKTFSLIDATRAYGDIRRVNALADDLEELYRYAKNGRM
jgi:predicted GIY-YIG superfamily endonuclease